MGSALSQMTGFQNRGNDSPAWNPNDIIIVGGPGKNDIPYSDEYAPFFCPRASEIPDADFVQSVRGPNRVFDTIHVIQDGRGAGSRVLCAAHRRCVKAARIVWDEQEAAGVPVENRVVIRIQFHGKLTPQQIFDLNVDENASKKDLTPTQRARLWKHAQTVMHMSTRDIAAKFKVAQSAVVNAVAIIECSAEIQARFDLDPTAPEFLSAQNAPTLAQLHKDQQTEVVKELDDAGLKPTAEVVKQVVKAKKQGKKVKDIKVTHSRSRGLVEKVRAKIWTGSEVDLAIEASGDLTERDRAIIAMVLDWHVGNKADNAEFQELSDECLGSKKDAEATEF